MIKEDAVNVQVGDAVFGGGEVILMAGPCAVENEEMLYLTARSVQDAGAKILRGGAYKPRSSPHDFQGLGKPALGMLQRVGKALNMPVVSEVLDTRDVEDVAACVDMLQVGSRNMQNTALLKEVGRSGKPVLLKRGLAATLTEWLLAAEYIIAAGNRKIVLCERGIRTFETSSRNTLDIASALLAKERSGLPTVADPSHASGNRNLVAPLGMAAIAAGLDGLLIEVHPAPEIALCDGKQSLELEEFALLARKIMALQAVS